MRMYIPAALLVSASMALASGRIEVGGKDTIDFGKYPARDKKVATYTIRNTGDDTLKILKVRKTCGCASAAATKTELKPGEEAQVEIVILPNTIFGLYSKNTFVESTDESNRFLKLNTSGNAIPLVEVTPSLSMDAGRIKENTEWRQAITLTATEPGAVLGQPVASNTHPVKVELVQTGSNAVAAYTLTLTLLPTVSPGDFQCKIDVPLLQPTNHPPISISVTGRIGTELAIIPGLAYLPLSDTAQTRTFTLRVLGARSRILKPEELVPPDNREISAKVIHNPAHNTLEATLTFSPEFVKELYADEMIPLTFSMPGTASAKVVCHIKK